MIYQGTIKWGDPIKLYEIFGKIPKMNYKQMNSLKYTITYLVWDYKDRGEPHLVLRLMVTKNKNIHLSVNPLLNPMEKSIIGIDKKGEYYSSHYDEKAKKHVYITGDNALRYNKKGNQNV